jgi:RHS repeat-associated protein
VWKASYLPFGGVQTTVETPITLRYPGQWFQAESGQHQNWTRDCDPTTVRYLQADPLGLVNGADGSKPRDGKGNWHNPETGDSVHPDLATRFPSHPD